MHEFILRKIGQRVLYFNMDTGVKLIGVESRVRKRDQSLDGCSKRAVA